MSSVQRPKFEVFKKSVLKNKKFKIEYEALRPEFELMEQFICARKKAKLSQTDLASKLHIQQSAIARLENGGYSKTSIIKLSKFAKALGYSLKISLIPAVRQLLNTVKIRDDCDYKSLRK